MYRDNKQLLTSEVHNFVLNHGALGDVITSLPAIVFARKFFDERLKLKVWAPPWQMDLIAHLLAPYGTFEVLDLMAFPRERAKRDDWDGGPSSLNTAVHSTHTRCRVHMVDYAFNFLINARPENMEQRSYPTAAPLGPRKIPEKYVVFPVGATSDNKLFKAKVMGPILMWCLDNGYRPVIVGTKQSHTKTEIDGELKPIVLREESQLISKSIFGRCLDMREQTTLLELRDLLGHAEAVVGVDGGTLHLAGTTDTNIVFASGTTLPKHRYVPRLGNPNHKIRYVGPRDLECTGCQSNWPLVTLHFTKCAYGDNKCMDNLHHDDFINGLKELGL
jgi:ADP-heptose:LPS heptosyltransferase